MPRTTKTYVLERTVPLPRGKVWELLSNTDHLNRALGLAPVDYSNVQDGDSTLVREARSSILGFAMRWKEYPFQWVRDECYSVLRVYSTGPLERLLGGIELSDAAADTTLRCYAELTPRGPAGATVGPIIAQRMLRRTYEYCERYFQLIAAAPVHRLPQPSTNTPASGAQLAFLMRRLSNTPQLPQDMVKQFGDFLRDGGDDEVASIRPYQLADNWGINRDVLLSLCLHATRCGLLNLSWNLMCPNCRVPKGTYDSLNQVTDQLHCDVCQVNYDVNFDRYVELRFAVHPSVRDVVARTYCIGGPFLAQHVLMQQSLEPGQARLLSLPDTQEELRLRVLRSNATVALDAHSPESRFSYGADGWKTEAAREVEPGSSLEIVNDCDHGIVVAIEKVDWDPAAVTAYRVTTLPEFRDMFGSEVLAPGQHVSVEHLTLLFSDLRDSTALYESIGDAPAYGSVRRHFDYMFERIAGCKGSVVKTIGDAVMAVFQSPEDALRAAFKIQADIDQLNASLGGREVIVIKLGLHHGPAIAVNSNERLDYFGRTVNIAARIGVASTGHDIVLSEACMERQGVQEILEREQATLIRFQANLKGIEGVFTLFRVELARQHQRH